MLCSNCGKPLGAVAHIWNDQLLCEACYLKAQSEAQTQTPHTTVFIAKHDDQERAEASQAIPLEANPAPTMPFAGAPAPSSPPASSGPQPQTLSVSAFDSKIFPGEHILWKRTFSKGIIHRHESFTEVITNYRATVFDDVLKEIVRACPLRNAVIVVTNTRRDSSQFRTGYGHEGEFVSSGMSTGRTLGDVQFFLNGSPVVTYRNVVDPFGLKRLVEGSEKSAK